MAKQKTYTRIAPTPSGLLHPGNGLSFLLTWAIARATGGKILLRIDDLDRARYRRAYVEDIFETLDWLGIDYDEGPSGVEDFERNWSQHQRLDLYHNELQKLREKELVFACDCSRKAIRTLSTDGRYPGTCLAQKKSLDIAYFAWRITPPIQNSQDKWTSWRAPENPPIQHPLDAFIVKQKNGFPAYQLASLVDDTHFGINFVVRGMDLWDSTRAQHYLAALLQKSSFQQATFWHHALLLDDNGLKLSKSKGAGSLQEWRKQGRSPDALFQQAEDILKQYDYTTKWNY